MADYIIENSLIRSTIRSMGCELISVVRKTDGREYMWCGNPDAWKRRSPILFPIIGKYNNNVYRYNGKEYPMGQHGFARNMEFELISKTETTLVMRLVETKDTLEIYPFHFEILYKYTLEDNDIKVNWVVRNTDEKEMYFCIGGHPAFACPDGKTSMAGCELEFETSKNTIKYGLLDPIGMLLPEIYDLPLNKNCYKITSDMFDKSAFIIENKQTGKVSLLNDGKPFVTVTFDAPVFGIWSPALKNVPFVCIEPWYGRADRFDYTGEIKDREWENKLKPGEVMDKFYHITFEG